MGGRLTATYDAVVTPNHDLEQLYAYPTDLDRPWVRTDFVSTIDGAAWTAAGVSGKLGGEVDKRAFSMMRALADVIVVGAGTARAEHYKALTESSTDQAVRQRNGLAPIPVLVIVSNSLVIPEHLVAGGAVVVTCANSPENFRSQLGDVIVAGDDDIDWAEVLNEFDRRGWRRVLCEGGPTLHGDLLTADVVDELCVTIAPTVSAGSAARIAQGSIPLDRPARLGHAVAINDVLLTRWVLDRS